jgi:imidazole glycerol-phosphate synthase subunit HisH
MKVSILDYGSGNLHSARRALERVGAQVDVTADLALAEEADALVIPGVGAFAACMAGINRVRAERLIDRRIAGGRPVFGICVGMQILFEAGEEHGQVTAGLGQWPGVVDRIEAEILPHTGWDTVEVPAGSLLFAGLHDARFSFVHSYAARAWMRPEDNPHQRPAIVTRCAYGSGFVAAVEDGSLCATQFHPEKSGDAGLELLRNWLRTIA